MKYIKILVLTFVFCSLAYAGPAALKNEDGSFKLNSDAEKIMNIEFQKIHTSGPWSIPSEALVKIKFSTGLYRRYEGDITFILVNVLKSENGKVLVSSQDIEPEDEIAIKGAAFLRLTEADLNSGTVDSCAH